MADSGAGAASGALWRFAVALYAQPDVAEACLRLQDQYGVDVNVLLFAAWMGAERGTELGDAEVAAAVAAVKPWSEEIVQPLRAVRRRLKAGPPPSPSAETEAARTKLKAAEIEMERIELTVLEDLGLEQRIDAGAGDAEAAAQNLRHVVAAYTGGDAAEAAADLVMRIARVLA